MCEHAINVYVIHRHAIAHSLRCVHVVLYARRFSLMQLLQLNVLLPIQAITYIDIYYYLLISLINQSNESKVTAL